MIEMKISLYKKPIALSNTGSHCGFNKADEDVELDSLKYNLSIYTDEQINIDTDKEI